MGDMLGLGVGMAAMNAMAPQFGEMMKGFSIGTPGTTGSTVNSEGMKEPDSTVAPQQIKCPSCGKILPAEAKFCMACGQAIV